MPIYEMMSGASIALAAFLLIVPGFFTDFLGFLLLIPFTRKMILKRFINKQKFKSNDHKKKFIDGEYEDISEDNDKKVWNSFKIY